MSKDSKTKWRVVADPSARYEIGSYNIRFQNESVILPLPLWQKIQKDLQHLIHKPESVLEYLLSHPLACRDDGWNLSVTAIAVKQLAGQMQETPFYYLVKEITKRLR